MKTLTWQKPGQQNVAQELIKIIINYVAELRENCDCLGILSIRSVNKELYAGEMKVLEIKDLSMFREFDFVQLQGQENGLPALFMQFAEHYKEKL